MINKMTDLLQNITESNERKINTEITPIEAGEDISEIDFFSADKKWHHFNDIVVVFVDLESSTKLNNQVQTESDLARIYNIVMGSAVKVFDNFNSRFIDIQGDGGFAVFWGKNRYKEALVSAITIQTMNGGMMEIIREKSENVESNGFKIGIASGSALVKYVGLTKRLARSANGQHEGWEEPVWSGNPVNFAAKASQVKAGGNIVITKSVYNRIERIKELSETCGCLVDAQGRITDTNQEPMPVWEECFIEKINDTENQGYSHAKEWCPTHGDDHVARLIGLHN